MYDPLGSASGLGSGSHSTGFSNLDSVPPWPTTPHTPNSPIPNLRPAPTPDRISDGNQFEKQAQIYGQPEPGLISPPENPASNGDKYEKTEPYLKVRITGLDRNRRDILVRFDAQTNLSNFTGTAYRNVSRSYVEFQQLYDALTHNNPQTIVPALPLAQTSAPTDEEDDRLIKIMLQRWFTRVCEDMILVYDEELRSFIESDFGYQPTPRPKRKTSSGFSLIRRHVPDEDEELQRARFELTKLEGQFFDSAKALDRVSLARKSLSVAHAETGNKLINVATTETHPPIANTLRKLGRTWHTLADLDQAQAISECVILSDSLGYQGLNARSAKETLQQRTAVLEEYQAAVKSAISKRRNIERLKASGNIRPEKVDEALEDLEEANKYEQILVRRADGISQNLHRALQTHGRLVTDDITTALIEYTRSSIMYERQLLRELESLRPDVASSNAKVVPKANGIPKPTVIPPLEDDFKPPPHPAEPTSSLSRGPVPSPSVPSNLISGRPSISHAPVSPQSPGASSSKSSVIASQPPRPPFVSQNSSPVTASPQVRNAEPPLGGRFVDGTKSMFVHSTSSSLDPSPVQAQSSGSPSTAQRSPHTDPLLGGPLMSSDPISRPGTTRGVSEVDPLGGIRPAYMSASVRVQPTRQRLDAREAASKLANMF
ncbi:Vps5 C terminal like-domain-containing protein [Multifurca ochricompacta]|uniref:Vps5 C terminal like-domain-containing protein n=1 Tax=Multifurca ochricompacta TaxID=376703 RepID=A0AAD4MBW2_9AGAM|nr:Vps5 C terminal like-domain-containing protein [Multifurca ochricompacta]